MNIRTEAETLFNFLNLRQDPQKADAIFILGGSSLDPVQMAADLYKKSMAPTIAFISIGGNFGGEKIWGIPENMMYRNVLVELGIPENVILSEGLTTNTLAEAQGAIPFLAKHQVTPSKMILVSRPVHQRRAFLTFVQQHPAIKFVNCPANEAFDSGDRELLQRMVDELDRIIKYGVKGDLKKEAIPGPVAAAAESVRFFLRPVPA